VHARKWKLYAATQDTAKLGTVLPSALHNAS
jgi:hypothetical protein